MTQSPRATHGDCYCAELGLHTTRMSLHDLGDRTIDGSCQPRWEPQLVVVRRLGLPRIDPAVPDEMVDQVG